MIDHPRLRIGQSQPLQQRKLQRLGSLMRERPRPVHHAHALVFQMLQIIQRVENSMPHAALPSRWAHAIEQQRILLLRRRRVVLVISCVQLESIHAARIQLLKQPNWFVPLFQQLDARGGNWLKLDARYHQYDAASPEQEYSRLFNRMRPSAWQRGVGHGIFYTLNYLKHLEDKGVRVVNGSRAFTHETSKALQLALLERLGLPYPKARVINHASRAVSAAETVGYPLIVKPNIGGSGAGIKRFSSRDELQAAVNEGSLHFGIDNTALVQECFTARDGIITRVEVLGGRYLYAIQIHITGETFDLCPADICKNTKGEELTRIACPVDAPKTGMTVEIYEATRQG